MPPAIQDVVKTDILTQFYSFLSVKEIAQLYKVCTTTICRLWRKNNLDIKYRPSLCKSSEKACTICCVVYPFTNEFFSKNRRVASGLRGDCKRCDNERSKKL